MKKNLFERVTENESFKIIRDGGVWNYDRFGFGELEGKVYRVELEGSESDGDVVELKDNLSVGGIIKEGDEKGFWEIDEDGVVYYEEDLEDEMMEWLDNFNK